MWPVIKRLSLAFGLLTICSSVLLLSDLERRRSSESEEIENRKTPAKLWKVYFITFVDSSFVEEAQEGTSAGFAEAGLVEGRDFEPIVRSAQGEITTLNSIVDAAINDNADLIYTYTTPALQTVYKKNLTMPTVFTLVVDPISWGLAKSYTDHPPNLTGVYLTLPADTMISVLRECIPDVRKIGTVFTPSESNSVYIMEILKEAAAKKGIELITVPAASSTEVQSAAVTLCQQDIDAFCQIPDNNTGSAFASIAQTVVKANIPLFVFSTPQAKMGAVVAVSADHFDSGRQGALLAARVIRGENPAKIPFEGLSKSQIVVNPEAAKHIGMVLPGSLMNRADQIIEKDGPIAAQQNESIKK
jgi:ABC-type uncharacterized transport system substrate-binding protein